MFKSMFHPEDGGIKVIRNVGILPQHCRCHNPQDLDLYLTIILQSPWFSKRPFLYRFPHKNCVWISCLLHL